ncbi:hypothetical protein BDB00DRAFT_871530 [Zychaea mexicana]|uniref:uncharacterized protein n=1 Tax=Zychaea mexicana TaxID=64656 RepID=UPI0022FF38DF|nr:uncharacterized protein BDB00DRAFT_871530 [Zychaea mexicana]KAI9494213.1 hypothetical protein BDB00DRAFT_871530 [Zychaea mexicana]
MLTRARCSSGIGTDQLKYSTVLKHLHIIFWEANTRNSTLTMVIMKAFKKEMHQYILELMHDGLLLKAKRERAVFSTSEVTLTVSKRITKRSDRNKPYKIMICALVKDVQLFKATNTQSGGYTFTLRLTIRHFKNNKPDAAPVVKVITSDATTSVAVDAPTLIMAHSICQEVFDTEFHTWYHSDTKQLRIKNEFLEKLVFVSETKNHKMSEQPLTSNSVPQIIKLLFYEAGLSGRY